MIIWITIKAFEALFNAAIDQSSLVFLHFLGFIELLIEIVTVILFIGALVYAFVSTRLAAKQ